MIARLSTGEWSAPSAIATIGCQYGFLAGADLTDYIVVLATDDAVRAFAGLGQFSVGGEIDVSNIYVYVCIYIYTSTNNVGFGINTLTEVVNYI